MDVRVPSICSIMMESLMGAICLLTCAYDICLIRLVGVISEDSLDALALETCQICQNCQRHTRLCVTIGIHFCWEGHRGSLCTARALRAHVARTARYF